ncbi:MAG: tetratricopeptide repeat protein, partial [Vicinamibacterales bacterium]
MWPSRNRRHVTVIALIVLALWLVAVVGVVLWRHPAFWIAPRERFQRAEVLASQKRWVDSIASIDLALAGEPNNVGYLVFKGYRQLDAGDPAGATQSFRRAIAVDQSDSDARLGLSTALVRSGRRDEALAMLDAIGPETMSVSQLHRRSQLYSALDAPSSALADVSVLLNLEPHNPVFLKNAAELAMMLKDWDRAASLLERLELVVTDSDVRTWITANRDIALEAAAWEAEQSDRHLDAANRFSMLAEENPDDARFRRAQAHTLRAAGKVGEAEAIFRDLVADGTADVATREAYAWLLNTQHRYAEAWRVVEPLPRPAEETRLLELQTRTAIWAGQTGESIQLIRALLQRRPADAELWKRLAEAWDTLKDDRQAADALAAYLRLQSQDSRARERLAQILAKQGSLDDAVAEYRQLLATQPRNPEFLRSLGLVQETAGHLEDATASYLQAIEVSNAPDPDLLLRVARLHRWTMRPEAAIQWYERYITQPLDDPLRRTGESELALALLDAGNPDAAAARLRSIDSPLNAAELVVAARAATAIVQPAAAARYLEALSRLRPLTPAEELWLAGQYRASGESDAALLLYERLAATSTETRPTVLEAIGDLRYDIGDFPAALRAFQQIDDLDRIALKTARTAARAGELALASETYDRYARSHPADLKGRLEAARYHANAGRPQIAITHYRAFIDTTGPADLRLELARVHLAAEQFETAEQWARQAIAAGEDADAAGLSLAQSLHLQGRQAEARAVLAILLKNTPAATGAHEWRGYVAVALDRHLEAFRSFDRAIAAGAPDSGNLLLLKGTAAAKRGDYARAVQSYAAASAAGATPAAADAARRELRAQTLPAMFVPVWGFGDSNGLRATQTGGGLLLFLPGLSGEVVLEASGGRLSQRQFSSGVNSVNLSLSRLFVTPELKIDLAMGFDQHDRAADLLTWHASGLYFLSDRAAFGLDARREALLPVNARPELRQFSRVMDVQAVGPGFYGDVFRGIVELAVRNDRGARAESGIEKLQDGNRRTFAYVHLQIP